MLGGQLCGVVYGLPSLFLEIIVTTFVCCSKLRCRWWIRWRTRTAMEWYREWWGDRKWSLYG